MRNRCFHPGINKNAGKIKIVEISPIQINRKRWYCVGFEPKNENKKDQIHLAFILNDKLNKSKAEDLYKLLKDTFSKSSNILTRFHSECLLGDALMSDACDCRKQLINSIKMITQNKTGVFIYLRQEGRGIGLRNKLSCLSLQEGYLNGKKIYKEFSSDEANLALGHSIDSREYKHATSLLKYLGVKSVNLITGNPDKLAALKKSGIKISKITDIPRFSFTKKEEKELKEKIERNYIYPFLINSNENL